METKNTKQSKNFSLFRITVLILINCFINNPWISLLFCFYLFITNHKETAVYLLFCLIFFVVYTKDFSILEKLEGIYNPIQQAVIIYIKNYSEETVSYLNEILLNQNNYDYPEIFGYGICSYYFLKVLQKRNIWLGLIVCILVSLFFGFEGKYLIFIVESLLLFTKTQGIDRHSIQILAILFIDVNWKDNYSFLILLFILLFQSIDSFITFRTFISFLQSILFGSINISAMFFYKIFIRLRIFLFLFSIILLIIPGLENSYLFLIHLFTDINELVDFEVKGSLSFIMICFYISILYTFEIKKETAQIFLLILMIMLPINHPYETIAFIDVGQGDAILFDGKLNDENILLDTGSSYNYYRLKKYLDSRRIKKIDYLIITHDDEDHNGNIDSLMNDYVVNHIITSGETIETNSFVLTYYPLSKSDNDNDNSLVYSLNKNGIEFLFTGDISETAETELIKEYTDRVDVLKVAHHGSDTSSSDFFISCILPKISIISTNGKYGHPSEETMDTLQRYDSKILITKEEGDIEFCFLLNICIVITDTQWFVII